MALATRTPVVGPQRALALGSQWAWLHWCCDLSSLRFVTSKRQWTTRVIMSAAEERLRPPTKHGPLQVEAMPSRIRHSIHQRLHRQCTHTSRMTRRLSQGSSSKYLCATSTVTPHTHTQKKTVRKLSKQTPLGLTHTTLDGTLTNSFPRQTSAVNKRPGAKISLKKGHRVKHTELRIVSFAVSSMINGHRFMHSFTMYGPCSFPKDFIVNASTPQAWSKKKKNVDAGCPLDVHSVDVRRTRRGPNNVSLTRTAAAIGTALPIAVVFPAQYIRLENAVRSRWTSVAREDRDRHPCGSDQCDYRIH